MFSTATMYTEPTGTAPNSLESGKSKVHPSSTTTSLTKNPLYSTPVALNPRPHLALRLCYSRPQWSACSKPENNNRIHLAQDANPP